MGHGRDVETRATHVAGHKIGKTCLHADAPRRYSARRRSGHDRVHGKVGRHCGGHHAAIPLHDQQFVAQPFTVQPLGQVAEIARHDRLDIAIERCRAAALELPRLAKYLGAERHEMVGPDLPSYLRAALLMRGVGV